MKCFIEIEDLIFVARIFRKTRQKMMIICLDTGYSGPIASSWIK